MFKPITFVEKRNLRGSYEKIYSCITDVDSYSKFMPYCLKSKVISRVVSKLENNVSMPELICFKKELKLLPFDLNQVEHTLMQANIEIGFSHLRANYTSSVMCFDSSIVIAKAQNSCLFHEMINAWKVTPITQESCSIEFFVRFQLRNSMQNAVANMVIDKVNKQIVTAFCNYVK